MAKLSKPEPNVYSNKLDLHYCLFTAKQFEMLTLTMTQPSILKRTDQQCEKITSHTKSCVENNNSLRKIIS